MLTTLWDSASSWGAFALLVLLSMGCLAYAGALVWRARWLMRQGWAVVRAHPAPLIGVCCGAAALAIAVAALAPVWLAGPANAGTLFHLHGWVGVPLIVFGFAFGYTAPGRRMSALERAQYARLRERPRQGVVGFALGAATWLPIPLAASLHAAPGLTSVAVLLLWPLALLAELIVSGWWIQRNAGLVEIGETGRPRWVPAYAIHPLFQGWLWGTVFIFLIIAMAGQIHAFP